MEISAVYERLIEAARQRVRSGTITERQLARQCGLSQPHMHNVLNSFRSLSTDSANRLMSALGIPMTALLFPGMDAGMEMVPLVRSRIGPGCDAALGQLNGFTAVPRRVVASAVNPIVARLAPDLAMPRELAANDLVLLDLNSEKRANCGKGGDLWVVSESAGLRIRHVRQTGAKVYLSNGEPVGESSGWQEGIMDRQILEVVLARIVWLSREFSGNLILADPS